MSDENSEEGRVIEPAKYDDIRFELGDPTVIGTGLADDGWIQLDLRGTKGFLTLTGSEQSMRDLYQRLGDVLMRRPPNI